MSRLIVTNAGAPLHAWIRQAVEIPAEIRQPLDWFTVLPATPHNGDEVKKLYQRYFGEFEKLSDFTDVQPTPTKTEAKEEKAQADKTQGSVVVLQDMLKHGRFYGQTICGCADCLALYDAASPAERDRYAASETFV